MLLERLREYADNRMAQPPRLYASTPIAAVIELAADGSLRSNRPTVTIDPSTARGKRGIDRFAPDLVRSSGIRPLLLADTGEYTLGVARDPAKQARATAAHEAYKTLVEDCASATNEPSVLAVKAFFDAGGPGLLELGNDWDYGLKLTFRVHLPEGAVFPTDRQTVQRFWAQANSAADDAEVLPCVVCGEFRPALESLQGKTKGIRGGQSSGTSIISANADAFESYGLERSHIAPTCGECGEKFTVALNELLGNERNRLYLGDTTFAYWTRSPDTDPDLEILFSPKAGDVTALLTSVRSGRRAISLESKAFWAVSLSGSGGRAVVRDWIDSTVDEVEAAVAHWFGLQEIVDGYGQPAEPLGLFSLAGSLVRKLDDLPKPAPRALLRSALTRTPLPLDFAFQAVRRNRAEQDITRPRAALLKLVLLSQSTTPIQEGYMVRLQVDHEAPAYHLGRLLAVLEEVQRAALPGINATIIDRFFGTASSAPAGVFGRLVRGAQPHLSRLERDRPGAYVALQRRMEEIMAKIDGFPRTLTLQEQATFSLGYYHQRADDRATAMANRNNSATTTNTSDEGESE